MFKAATQKNKCVQLPLDKFALRVHTGDNMKLFTMCLCVAVQSTDFLHTALGCVYLKDLLNFFTLFNRVTRISVQMRGQQQKPTRVCLFS